MPASPSARRSSGNVPPPAADPDPGAPLGPPEFAALMAGLGPFESRPALAVGVSGGPDSLALAILAAAWAGARGGSVLALTVDHGLRPESAQEAETVQAWLGARRIPSRILRWAGPKPASGLQEAAREARYRLLAEAARAAGILHLLVAHQREDQAETVAMRRARRSGLAGLAGMAGVRELPGVRLLRPLLDIPKARLKATLGQIGQPWIDDPSNREPAFERARLRAGHQMAPVDPAGLSAAAAERRREEAAVARLLARCASPRPLGWVRIDREPFDDADRRTRAALLAAVLRAVGGGAFLPRMDAVRALLEEAGGRSVRLTLGGCIVAVRARWLTVCREPDAARDIRVMRADDLALWDGRFEIAVARSDGPVEARRLGVAGRLLLPPGLRAALRVLGVPAVAIEALPGLWQGARLVDCPVLRSHGPSPAGVTATARLAPRHPLAVVPFGQPIIVSSPGRFI